MNVFQDLTGGWRARPLNTLAGAFLALGLSLLLSAGLWMLEKAESETQNLLASWPQDQCTLLLPQTIRAEEWLEVRNRLPDSNWLAVEISGRTAWITGTLPEDFFDGQGSSLPPDVIFKGDPAVLLLEDSENLRQPGDLLLLNERAYRIYGVGRFSLPAERVIPRKALSLEPAPPQYIQIRKPASEVIPVLTELLNRQGYQLVDHQEKHFTALQGFRKLRLNLTGIALASAFLVALLLQALYQAEIRERKAEFALRRSLGARPQDIRNQLFLETFAQSALPCLLGTLVFSPLVSPVRLSLAFILTLGWILLCASLPALQAARHHPGDALKGE